MTMRKLTLASVSILLVALSGSIHPGLLGAQAFIRVTGDGVNIRTAPNGTVIVQARRGDVFETTGREGAWEKIKMFSGEDRYVHSSLVTSAQEAPRLPSAEGERRRAFNALLEAEDRSYAESEEQIPRVDVPSIRRSGVIQNVLVLCSQSLFRFADLGDDGLCRGGPDKGCGVIVSAIDVVVDRLD